MSEEDRRLVGKRLRALRAARWISIDALAHRLGCTPGTVSNAELGRWHISVALLDRWLRLLGIDLLTAIGARKFDGKPKK